MEQYLHIGRADDLKDKKDRYTYRALEIMPGVLAWGTLVIIVALSFITPRAMAIFIIAFDIYWLVKAIYVSLHMRSSFTRMNQSLRREWVRDLDALALLHPILGNVHWKDLHHLVIVPMYREPLSVVAASFHGLAQSNYPLERMIVVLATEERAGSQAQETARAIEKEFGNLFFKFLITRHPQDISGEQAGKGSNETWAAKTVKESFIDPLHLPYERIITSVFDVDTIVPRDFFSCLTYHYLTALNPLRASFQPIPLFTNNIWEAPAFARIFAFSTTFWQMIQQARPERLVTFSSQSISFRALVDVDFWQVNVVSEDSRIFWQCLLRYDGNWQTVPLYYPVYMDANVAPTFWETLKNQYRQIRRWAYGVENNPYFLFGFTKNKRMPFLQKLNTALFMIESSHSLPTNSIIIFLLGWLPITVGGGAFSGTILSYNLPQITRFIMSLAMIGLVSSAIISVILLPPRPPRYGRFSVVWMLLQWLLFPFNLIFFGAIPALDAQTRLMLGKYLGFWVTPKSRNILTTQSGSSP